MKVGADTLPSPVFISWPWFELIFGNWYFRGYGVSREILILFVSVGQGFEFRLVHFDDERSMVVLKCG